MINYDLLKNILLIAIASSIISTSLVQKIKEATMSKKFLPFISLLISILVGIAFSFSFTDINIIYSLWVGLISFIGADTLYKTFEDKIFSSLSSLEKVIYIERSNLPCA